MAWKNALQENKYCFGKNKKWRKRENVSLEDIKMMNSKVTWMYNTD